MKAGPKAPEVHHRVVAAAAQSSAPCGIQRESSARSAVRKRVFVQASQIRCGVVAAVHSAMLYALRRTRQLPANICAVSAVNSWRCSFISTPAEVPLLPRQVARLGCRHRHQEAVALAPCSGSAQCSS